MSKFDNSRVVLNEGGEVVQKLGEGGVSSFLFFIFIFGSPGVGIYNQK